jgi:hypothetical protein
MILHAASIMAVFVDHAPQAQYTAQCAQAAPWTWWERLLQFLPQLIVSVIPVAGGVWIANRSFTKTKELTEWSFRATSERDHERWILDQKKAEWSAILSSLTAADVKLPHVFSNVEWSTMSDEMLQDIRNVLPVMRNAIFVRDVLEQEKVIDGFRDFVSEAAEKIKTIKDFIGIIDGIAGTSTLTGSVPGAAPLPDVVALNRVMSKQMANRERTYGELYKGFHEQANKIRTVALGTFLSGKANDEP